MQIEYANSNGREFSRHSSAEIRLRVSSKFTKVTHKSGKRMIREKKPNISLLFHAQRIFISVARYNIIKAFPKLNAVSSNSS